MSGHHLLARPMHAPVLFVATSLLIGCGFRSSAAPSDAPSDAPVADAPDAAPCVTWGALNVMPCDPAIGVPRDLTLSPGTYVLDTGSGQLSGGMTQQLPGALIAQGSGPMLRVVNLGQLSIM